MKLILIGYGKMGKAVEHIAADNGHKIGKIITSGNLNSLNPGHGEVALEFSTPQSAFANILYCIENGIPVISGTTGWLERMDEIKTICREKEGTFFYAPNFSISVNIFLRVNRLVAKTLDKEDYAINISEIHHLEKKDSPSGTAIALAQEILQNNRKYKRWSKEETSDSIQIKSVREANIPGTHSVHFTSNYDKISLKHEALGREGFAIGAIKVAEWINGKKGVLTMDDFLKF